MSSRQRDDARAAHLAIARHQTDRMHHACAADDFVRRVTSEVQPRRRAGDGQVDRPNMKAREHAHDVGVAEIESDPPFLGELRDFPDSAVGTRRRASKGRTRARRGGTDPFRSATLPAVDLLAARIANRLRVQHARAERLRAQVPACARLLRARGARRVVLFGSLATGAQPHESTDVDLAVWGLSEAAARDLILDLEDLVSAEVDLVRMESAAPSLVSRVAQDGLEIDDVAR